MFLTRPKSLLPKGLLDGVAPKTIASLHQFPRLGGLRKLTIFRRVFTLAKITLGGIILGYLLGYQPTLAFPLFKQAIVRAEFSQDQQIQAGSLSQAVQLPHPGYLTTTFSSWHPGVDIATGLGMPLRPILNGKVAEVVWGFWGLGHSVVIEHEQGYRSVYGHMGRIFVKKGADVTTADIIGEVGMTGNTSGPHTHLEITRFGSYIDPLALLPPLPNWPTNINTNVPRGQREIFREPQAAISPTPSPVPSQPLTLDLTKIGYPKLEKEQPKTLPLPLLLPLVQP